MPQIYRHKLDFRASCKNEVFSPFLAAAAVGGLGCADVVLPVDGAVLTLETVVLAVGVVESLVVAAGGLDVVDVGREVERIGEGLRQRKTVCRKLKKKTKQTKKP